MSIHALVIIHDHIAVTFKRYLAAMTASCCADLQVAQLASKVQGGGGDVGAVQRSEDDLQKCFEQVQEQLVKTHGERERDLLEALDAVQERQVALRAHVKALSHGYRALRYQVEDAVAQGGLTLPGKVVHENQLLGEAAANVLANDEDADRRLFQKLQHAQAAGGQDMRAVGRSSPDVPRMHAAQPSAEDSFVKKENQRLRTELENLHRIIQDSVATARGGDAAVQAELAQLRIHNARLAADRTTERDQAISLGMTCASTCVA